MSFYRTSTHKARKEHQCTWCHKTITKGDNYVIEVGVYDNELSSAKYHHRCRMEMNFTLRNLDPSDPDDMNVELLRDTFDEDHKEDFRDLFGD